MSRLRVSGYLTCVALLLVAFGGLIVPPTVLAMSNGGVDLSVPSPSQKSPSSEEIKLTCQYPVLSSYAGTYFAYSIEIQYTGGEEPRLFNLKVKVPTGFNYSITPGYGEGTEIAAIRLDPKKTYPDTLRVTIRPYVWLVPEPGEYSIIVEAVSDTLKNSLELKAIVTAKYDLDLKTSTGRLNTNATAGGDNYLKISITNTGSADLEKIDFSSKITGRPTGWSITFDPEKIDSLPVSSTREIQVNIKPDKKTISGDYMVNISAEPESKYAFGSLDIRVTVLTPTIWGWVGIGIVVLVIVGLAVMFMRLGRR
jgi:uncharacterized membrane protein